jgi:hypothetical protein
MLVDLFESIEQFFKRLECCTEIQLTERVIVLIVRIVAEVLSSLALVTRRRSSRVDQVS